MLPGNISSVTGPDLYIVFAPVIVQLMPFSCLIKLMSFSVTNMINSVPSGKMAIRRVLSNPILSAPVQVKTAPGLTPCAGHGIRRGWPRSTSFVVAVVSRKGLISENKRRISSGLSYKSTSSKKKDNRYSHTPLGATVKLTAIIVKLTATN